MGAHARKGLQLNNSASEAGAGDDEWRAANLVLFFGDEILVDLPQRGATRQNRLHPKARLVVGNVRTDRGHTAPYALLSAY